MSWPKNHCTPEMIASEQQAEKRRQQLRARMAEVEKQHIEADIREYAEIEAKRSRLSASQRRAVIGRVEAWRSQHHTTNEARG